MTPDPEERIAQVVLMVTQIAASRWGDICLVPEHVRTDLRAHVEWPWPEAWPSMTWREFSEALALARSSEATRKPAFATDYQRMWDLCRHQRAELLDANLITREEFSSLLSDETASKPGQGSPSARRLEIYDELRATSATLLKERDELDALHQEANALARRNFDRWHHAEADAARLREALTKAGEAMVSHNAHVHPDWCVYDDDDCRFDFAGTLAMIEAALATSPESSAKEKG